MRHSIAAPSIAVLLAVGGAPSASAGPLAETVRGVENKTESRDPSPPSSPGPSSDHRGESDDRYDSYSPDATSCYNCSSGVVWVGASGHGQGGSGSAAPFLPGPGRLDLYLGAHAVVDSDGALVGEVRASRSWLGISASNTSYFERIEADRARRPAASRPPTRSAWT